MSIFFVESTIQNPKAMSRQLLEEHKQYTQAVMEQGHYLFSSLKTDHSGGAFMIKAPSQEWLEEYLAKEPFYLAGVQTYRIQPLEVHWNNPQANGWFKD
ncbi:MAG: YciI family protein [Candidatus Fournierella pullistercoris]|uniref:YciI family protein n=1 Tax=Candidatus Allofournierella pullistercoris TaxID=2838597 RepID=A0A948T3H4_9FIRM|nr:YciI family protein [Candidatus Fournierella pullistercoris]